MSCSWRRVVISLAHLSKPCCSAPKGAECESQRNSSKSPSRSTARRSPAQRHRRIDRMRNKGERHNVLRHTDSPLMLPPPPPMHRFTHLPLACDANDTPFKRSASPYIDPATGNCSRMNDRCTRRGHPRRTCTQRPSPASSLIALAAGASTTACAAPAPPAASNAACCCARVVIQAARCSCSHSWPALSFMAPSSCRWSG